MHESKGQRIGKAPSLHPLHFSSSIHEVPSLGSSFAVLFWPSQLSSFPISFTPSLTLSHTQTHTYQASQVPLLVVWYTLGGGGPHVLTLLEHSYCMLEGQLEVITTKKEEEQTTSVYQSSHNTLSSLLGHRVDEHTCMGLSIRQKTMLIAHFTLYMITMSHVPSVTLQHEKLFWWFLHNFPAHHPGPESTMVISWQSVMIIIV